MKSSTIPVLLATLLYNSIAFSQLNESDTTGFQFRAGSSGTWQSGNVDLLVIRSRLELVSNGKKNLVFKSQFNNLHQEFGHKKADNDLYSRNFLYFQPRSPYYPFIMTFIQSNFRRNIDIRWFAGTGGTFQALRKPNSNLKISASLVREVTRFNDDAYNQRYYDGNKNISVWRGTIYLAGLHRLLGNKMKIFYNGNWQPAFDEVPNNRVQLDIGMEISVWQGLNLQFEYLYNYEQVVARRIKEVDRILTFGINYQIRK